MIQKFLRKKVTPLTNSTVTEETTTPTVVETPGKTTTSNLKSEPLKNLDKKTHKPSQLLTSSKNKNTINKSKEKTKIRKYDENYISLGFTYLVINNIQHPLCFICGDKLTNHSLKPQKLEIHFKQHEDWHSSSEETMKKQLQKFQGNQFNNNNSIITQDKLLKIASYMVAYEIAKNKKSYLSGEKLIKPILKQIAILFFGIKDSYLMDKIPLSNNTMASRTIELADDIISQILHKVKNSFNGLFSIQLDESTDIDSKAQLSGFVRWCEEDGIKEDIFFFEALPTSTTGRDIFAKLDEIFVESDLDWHKLVSITTDGAPAMLGGKTGLASFVKKKCPSSISLHCMIHRAALAARVLPLDFKNVIDVCIQMINHIKNRPLKARLFGQMCIEAEEDYEKLLWYSPVRWLSRGQMLQRIFDLRSTIVIFSENNDELKDLSMEFTTVSFQQTLAYLTDIFNKLNKLNISLQGRDSNIISLSDNLSAFLIKIDVWVLSIEKGYYTDFQNFNSLGGTKEIQINKLIINHLTSLKSELKRYFPHLGNFDTSLISNPFKYNPQLIPDTIRDEFIDMVNSTRFKLLFADVSKKELAIETFWSNVAFSFPSIGEYVIRVILPFGSSYLCEQSFSVLTNIKDKLRSKIDVKHQLICAISKIEPRIKKLADKKGKKKRK